VGTKLVEELRVRARREGYDKLCAFTHAPAYFIQMGFSIVPHLWIPEKIFTDCVKCPQFRQCGQYAMVLPLDSIGDSIDNDATTLVARHA
jgi:amino-acid N-acetyltransferase